MLATVEKASEIRENTMSWCYHLVFITCLILCEELEIEEDRDSQETQNLLNQGWCHKPGERDCLGKRIGHYAKVKEGRGSILGAVSFVYVGH